MSLSTNKCITRLCPSESKHINSDFLNNIFDDIYNNTVKLTTTNKLKKIDCFWNGIKYFK